MIRVKELSIIYSGQPVLDTISIDFEENSICGIVGFNGAGKTTFFNALSATIKLDNGKITLNEIPLSEKEVAYLETVNFFYSGITGNEYLRIFDQSNANFDLVALQEFLKLPLDELIENYSTGMKKKLALLGMLKQNKSIYLLDEPFNGLDLETTKIMELIIHSLKEKRKTIFLSSHIIDPLLVLCDKIYFLEAGKFVKQFNKTEFGKIEEELFGKLKTEARTIISQSI